MEAQDQNEIRKVVREVVQEALSPVNTRLSSIEERLGKTVTDERLDATFGRQATLLQQEFQNVSKRISALEARVAKLEERMGFVEDQMRMMLRRMETMSDAISEMRSDTAKIRSDALTTEERLAALEARIAKLEAMPHG